ncbi:MAG: NAD-dependent epimerase/dehydratase family protein [Xanthomonadales bacterium]|nr:NAD-dependent epimerase/dehydratase family protein [Xanthomonadales bacterium]
MRVLIAGCGDVGGVLAELLLADGHAVYGLKRDPSTLPEGVRGVQADLLQGNTLKALPGRIDRLVYMPTPGNRDRAGYEAIFLQGWKNLWNALDREPDRTLLVSSTAVYGESNGTEVDEDTIARPARFNGETLLEMERLAASCTQNLVVARLSGIYGPGRERLISQAATGGLEVQQAPPFFTNRIHRDDAARALQHLLELENPEMLYVVTDDNPAPRFEVVKWLALMQGKPAPVATVNEQAGQGKRASNRRLRASGFELRYPDYMAGYGAVLATRRNPG